MIGHERPRRPHPKREDDRPANMERSRRPQECTSRRALVADEKTPRPRRTTVQPVRADHGKQQGDDHPSSRPPAKEPVTGETFRTWPSVAFGDRLSRASIIETGWVTREPLGNAPHELPRLARARSRFAFKTRFRTSVNGPATSVDPRESGTRPHAAPYACMPGTGSWPSSDHTPGNNLRSRRYSNACRSPSLVHQGHRTNGSRPRAPSGNADSGCAAVLPS